MASEKQARVLTLIALFRVSARLMVDELVARLQAAGYADITAAHHPVFESIDPKGSRLTTLATRTGMTHQSMGELVAVLERNGYLDRTPDPSDRRARLVTLTPKGRKLARTAVNEISAIEATWHERLTHAGLDADLRAILETALREPTN